LAHFRCSQPFAPIRLNTNLPTWLPATKPSPITDFPPVILVLTAASTSEHPSFFPLQQLLLLSPIVTTMSSDYSDDDMPLARPNGHREYYPNSNSDNFQVAIRACTTSTTSRPPQPQLPTTLLHSLTHHAHEYPSSTHCLVLLTPS
jgi:hypothetical protein